MLWVLVVVGFGVTGCGGDVYVAAGNGREKREEVLLDFNRLVAMVGEGDRKNSMGGLYCSVLHDGLLGAAGLYMYLTY